MVKVNMFWPVSLMPYFLLAGIPYKERTVNNIQGVADPKSL